MALPRKKKYEKGLIDFLNLAFSASSVNDKILRPCKRCFNVELQSRAVAHLHLLKAGFKTGYTHWDLHGENTPSLPVDENEVYIMKGVIIWKQ